MPASLTAAQENIINKLGPSDAEVELEPYVPNKELTRKEAETLRLSAHGYNQQQVASFLGINVRTVQFHCDNIYRKLGVHCMVAALFAAGYLNGHKHAVPHQSITEAIRKVE